MWERFKEKNVLIEYDENVHKRCASCDGIGIDWPGNCSDCSGKGFVDKTRQELFKDQLSKSES